MPAPLKPLPPWQHPFLNSDLRASREFYEYLRTLDQFLRAGVPNVQSANYVLQLGDVAGVVEMNVGSANTLTVPPSSQVAFPIGRFAMIRIVQIGAGQTTLTAGAGVTIRTRLGLKIAGQYGVASLYKRGADDWVAFGDLSA